MRRSARSSAAILAVVLAAAAPAAAGLRFLPVPLLEGADASSIATDGTVAWLATARGVFRLSGGTWASDGLAGQMVTAVAVAGGSVWAATGDALYRRTGPGTWDVETLPSASARPSVLLADGGLLWAGGSGVFRWDGSWTALPSFGPGVVTGLGRWGSNLVAGTTVGGAASWNGSSWVPMFLGMGAAEAPVAFATDGSTLLAGTWRGLYAWNGSAWTGDAAFGLHDVRAIVSSSGTLRAATEDAGVLLRSGYSWRLESEGVAGPSARAFASRGSDLLLATGGGPVYRLSGSSWRVEGSSLNGASISALSSTPQLGCYAPDGALGVAGSGGGAFWYVPVPGGPSCAVVPTGLAPPDGCGDVWDAVLSPVPPMPAFDAALATNCGVWLARTASGGFAASGLPAGERVTALERTPDGLAGGTGSTGVFLYTGSGWSALGTGLPGNAAVTTLHLAGGTLWAGTARGLYRKEPGSAAWTRTNTGLYDDRGARSLAGTDPLFSVFLVGGLFRRDGASEWREDSYGLQGQTVFSIEAAGGKLWAAAGTVGVATKSEGGFVAETAGLPPGTDVRVVRFLESVESGTGGPTTSRTLYAGTAGNGLFAASVSPAVKTLPVVLDVGTEPLRYRTELTIGNRGAVSIPVRILFVPAPGFAPAWGTIPEVTRTIRPGQELRIPDAVSFLRDAGVPLPAPGPTTPVAGSLTLSADTPLTPGAATDAVYAVARTFAGEASRGTFGLFYGALADVEAAEDEASVYGLRTVPGVSRSNLAVVHLPGRETGPISLSVQVYSEAGAAAGNPFVLSLLPGEWAQLNGILSRAGLPDGSFGYARILRTSGMGAFAAYGVVNDAKTNDGSYLPAYRPGGLGSARRLVVPVVLDAYGSGGSHFTSELTLANLTRVGTLVDLMYTPATGFGRAPGVPFVTLSLASRAQTTIPDTIQFLRDSGVAIPDPAVEGNQVGTLAVDFRYLENVGPGDTVALVRTSTPNPDTAVGGSFGLAYQAAARGGGARTSALIPALARDDSVRANLAVLHAGGGSGLPVTLEATLYDADSGAAIGNPLVVTLSAGDWWQWSGVAEAAGIPGTTTRFYAVVRRTSGDDTFLAYGVVNDNVTSDGSYLPMLAAESW